MASVNVVSVYHPKIGVYHPSGPSFGRPSKEEFIREWKALPFFKYNELEIFEEETLNKVDKMLKEMEPFIIKYSDYIEITVKTMGSKYNMYDHITKLHYENLFKDYAHIYGFEYVIKFAHLLYIDDSIIRFFPELEIKPKIPTLKSIIIAGLYDEIFDWVFAMEKIYRFFIHRRDKNYVIKTIDWLYEEAPKVIETAINNGWYLPISPTRITSTNTDRLKNKIITSWRRNRNVSPGLLVEYFYSVELGRFNE
jgi:hypothetical protein